MILVTHCSVDKETTKRGYIDTDHDLHTQCKSGHVYCSFPQPNCVAATRTSISKVIRSYIKTKKCLGEEGQRWPGMKFKKQKRKKGYRLIRKGGN